MVPRINAAVMVVTVVVTHNLAIGVFAGVILSGIFFASISELIYQFDYKTDANQVIIDLREAHLGMIQQLVQLKKSKSNLSKNNIDVTIDGINSDSSRLMKK
ncbi:hypothetical protein [Halalkalibacter urbisdiaboli]|uniref:hypothetical protein n=1 Tax=Halalkalibacter urbisdiaboli TaxID=1960589 RepID=UPI0010548E61|nr:hypothetical protein [Halalkalibacter urbisdiaboli]